MTTDAHNRRQFLGATALTAALPLAHSVAAQLGAQYDVDRGIVRVSGNGCAPQSLIASELFGLERARSRVPIRSKPNELAKPYGLKPFHVAVPANTIT